MLKKSGFSLVIFILVLFSTQLRAQMNLNPSTHAASGFEAASDENIGVVKNNLIILATDLDYQSPVFTSATTTTFTENGTGTAYTAVATDDNTITYSLGTGNDEVLFNIVGTSGVITFKSSPDFESPTDKNADNAYVLEVKASDGVNEVGQIITINVTDDNDDPTITSNPVTSVADNSTYRYEIKTNDLENDAVTISATTLPSWLTLEQQALGVVTTFAGSGTFGSTDGTGTAAEFSQPYGLSIDPFDNLYIADFSSNTIRKITPGGVVTTFAGSTANNESKNGTGNSAGFAGPIGMGADKNGNIYVTDNNTSTIRKITPSGVVTTVAGTGSGGYSDGQGLLAAFNAPTDLTVDSKGNIFIADTYNHRIRKITPAGVVSTFAGSGEQALKDGIGTDAAFYRPFGITIDNADNLYIADNRNHSIRKITPEGVVTTIAGNGVAGFVDGVGQQTRFQNPAYLTSDANGTLYVADFGNKKIRKISTDGTVSTLAGSNIDNTQDGVGMEASFNGLFGIVLDSQGNLFITESSSRTVRKLSLSSPLPVLVGNPAGQAGSHSVEIKAQDANGGSNLQSFVVNVSDTPPEFAFGTNPFTKFKENGLGSVITMKAIDAGPVTYSIGSSLDGGFFKINESTGVVNFKNTPDFENPMDSDKTNTYLTQIYARDDKSLSAVALLTVIVTNADDQDPSFVSSPITVVNDNENYEYIIEAQDLDGERLQITGDNLPDWLTLTNESHAVTSTFVGSGEKKLVDGTGTSSAFNAPVDVAMDSQGNFYVADFSNHSIRKITSDGVVTTFAGTGQPGDLDGNGTAASFNQPRSVAVDRNDNILVSDSGNNKIRKISKNGQVTTIAGGAAGDQDGPGTTAQFNSPRGLTVDSNDVIYLADGRNNKIRLISPAGVVSTLTNGTGSTASFSNPQDVALDSQGNIYVADWGNFSIRKVTPNGVVTTVAGSIGNLGNLNQPSEDGIAAAASFNLPQGIVVDKADNIYMTESYHSNVRKISPSGIVSTIVGNDVKGFSNGTGSAALFSAPHGLMIDKDGNLLVADGGNNRIRKVTIGGTKLTGSTIGQAGTHTVDLKVKDASGPATTQSFTITVNDVTNPVFTAPATINFAENGTGTAYTAVATDANTITYSLGAGNDEGLFDIVSTTGVVTFKASPDFEAPADANTDNAYIIEVKASDGVNTASLALTITVTDIDDTDPVFTSTATTNFTENSTGSAYTAVATDASTITYSLGTANDEGLFDIVATSGIVTFKAFPDFEAPDDKNADNAYVIQVNANDGTNTATQMVTITVSDDQIDNKSIIYSGTGFIEETINDGTVIGSIDISLHGTTFSDADNEGYLSLNNQVVINNIPEGLNPLLTINKNIPAASEWFARSVKSSNRWSSVTFGNEIFLAVSPVGTKRVISSEDGITWSSNDAAEENTWTSVTYGNGTFVAVSIDGANRVMTSTDGINWTARTTALSSWISVTYGNGLFVAVATGSDQVMISNDGINWQSQTAIAALDWRSVTFGNGLFVAVARNPSNQIMTSPDGVNWTARQSPASEDWSAITFGKGMFVAVADGSLGKTNRIMTSLDGINWRTHNAPVENAWVSITYGADLFVATGLGTSNQVMTSTNGEDWVVFTVPFSGTIRSVTYGKGLFVASSENSGRLSIRTSSAIGTASAKLTLTGNAALHESADEVNGITFEFKDSAFNGALASEIAGATRPTGTDIGIEYANSSKIVYAGPGFKEVEGNDGSVTGSIEIRLNGTLFQDDDLDKSIDIPEEVILQNIPSGLKPKLTISTTTIEHSQWVSRETPDGNWVSMAYGNNTFVGISIDGISQIMTSSDGVKWTATAAAESSTWFSIEYGNGVFIAISLQNRIMRSADGINWTTVPNPDNLAWRSITFGNGTFVMLSGGSASKSYTSIDGENWKLSDIGQIASWEAIGFGNGLFVALSGVNRDYVITSPDGINWTERKIPNSTIWKSISYGNGVFVAVANTDAQRIMTSIDGITWMPQNAPENNAWNSVTFGGGLFVATATNGDNPIMTSKDALNWELQKSPSFTPLQSVAYGNGRFVGVSRSAITSSLTGASKAILTFSGNAEVHENMNSLTDISFKFTDKAFLLQNATMINGAIGPSGRGIQFENSIDNTNPVFTSPTTSIFTESGTGTAYTAVATDANTITYSLGTGNDEGLFDVVSTTGVITFKNSPDFEVPIDANIDNAYVLEVKASDGVNTVSQTVTITVTDFDDVKPIFTSTPILTVNDNEAYNYDIKTFDSDSRLVEISAPTNLPAWLALKSPPPDNVSTLAGSLSQGPLDGQGSEARFKYPNDVAVGPNGNIYVADKFGHVIRKVTPSGQVTTIAGSVKGYADGPALSAKFNNPYALTVDPTGVIYVADAANDRIRKIDLNGNVTTLSGSNLNNPTGVAIDGSGNIFIADRGNYRIRKITPSGVVSTLAGSGVKGYTDGIGTEAQFGLINLIGVTKEGIVYVPDTENNRIRRIDKDGVVTTIAGSGVAGYLDANGTEAMFNLPTDVSFDNYGNVYVADLDNNRIRKISSSGEVTTVAGSGNFDFADGIGSSASFRQPIGIDFDNNGNLYVADLINQRVRKISGGSLALAGNAVGQSGSHPVSLIAMDNAGNKAEQSFTITVNDATNPVFTSNAALSFVENGTGTAYTIAATDANTITYSLGTGNDEGLFDVVSTTGVITFKNSPDFESPADANTDNAYVLEVKANDGTNASTQLVTITVTDADEVLPQVIVSSTSSALVYTPSFKTTFTFSESVTGFDASDLTVTNGSISAFTGSGNTYSALVIATTDGPVSVQIAKDIAQDAAGNKNVVSNLLSRKVEATNLAPSSVDLSANKILENVTPPTEVGTLSATDADENDRHTFAFVDGTGSTNNSLFRIIDNKLIARAAFDYETIKVASIRIRATDARGLSLDAVKQIEILNIAEPKISTFIPNLDNPSLGDPNLLFKATRTGQTATRTLEVTNSGTDGDLSIINITLPSGFTVDKTTATIAQGKKEVLTVTFSPTEEKIYAGSILLTSNAGVRKVSLGGRGEQNRAPIAVSPNAEVFFNVSDLLQLRGYDPDGDAIEFVITQQPQHGTIAATTGGLYGFTPNSLTPGQLYQDVVKFKVVETGGGLESAEAELKFKFRINDQAHAINSLAVSSKTDEKIVFDLKFLDPVLNDAYQLKVSYYNLTDPTSPVFVPLLSQSITKSAITTTSGVHGFAFESASSGHSYLFSTSRVFMVVELTTANGYSASDGYILRNESSGSNIATIEGAGSTDGEFFVFASQTTVPENESVELNLFAVDLGSFSLSDATIAITKSALKGSSTAPVAVKKTDNLAQWKLTYSSETEIGLLDSLQFTVTNPSRSADANAYAKVEVIEVADAPQLSAIADQQTNEEETITVDLVVTDPDSELTITVISSETTSVPVTMVGNKLIITPGKDFNGTANISVLVTESNSSSPLSTFDEFQLTVVPVNDKPLMTAISDLSVAEDGQLVVTLSATDVDASLPVFSYVASTDNQDNVSYTIEGDVLTITPAANYNGTITFGVTADDGAGTANSVSVSEAFSLTVSPQNDAPTSSATINTQTLLEVIPAYTLDLAQYFTDVETSAKELTYTVSSISNAGLAISGATLTISSLAGASGVETATITASDGELSVSQNVTFVATNASTDVTVANPVTDQVLAEDFGLSSIDLSNVFALSGNAGASFTYILTGNNTIGASMNGSSLELTSVADFNGADELIIIGTADGKSSFTSFKITVNPANDAPNLVTAINDVIAREDAVLAQVISANAFSDIDGDALTYSASYSAAWLSFDAATRTFSGTPANGDVGTVAVTITATDPSGATATDSFNLVVSNTNDNPTAITFASKLFNENLALNSVVSTLTSIDADAGDDSFTYTLVSGSGSDDNASFDIIGNQLVTASTFDFESKASYSIRIKTTDGFEGSYTETVTIAVTNVNEVATAIGLPVTTIAENQSIGTIVSTLTTTDPDASDTHSYSLVSGDGDTDNANFTMTDGNLTAASAFDFETKSSYAVRIKTTDAGGLSLENTFTVSISNANDAATDLNLSAATIAENASISTEIADLLTTDPDAGDTHGYSLVAGEGDVDNANFKIEGAKLLAASSFNFENKSSYSMRLKSTDASGLSFEKSFTITVTDVNDAPNGISSDNLTIEENQDSGTTIGSLTTLDQDSGDVHSYSLVTGDGDADNASFSLDGNALKTAASFDFETKSSYSLRVKTTDAGGLSYEITFQVAVTNQAEAQMRLENNATLDPIAVGATATFNITVFNDGDGAMNVTSITYPEGFSGVGSISEIAPSTSAALTVSFSPTEAKTYSGDLVLIYNGGAQVAAVSAVGEVITSIDDGIIDEALIKMYPNPTTDEFTLDLTSFNGQPIEISLVNGSGVGVYVAKDIRTSKYTVRVSSYSQGIYIVMLRSGKQLIQKKLVIKR